MNARTDLPLGLVHGMSNADYHALPALGASGLKKLAKSPYHFFGSTLDPDRPGGATTAAMSAGTLLHCAFLEPSEILNRYVVKPPGQDGRTKEGKAWLETVGAREVVSADQMRTAERQAAALLALPDVAALMAAGESEVSSFWIDDETGEWCKCRPDRVTAAGDGVILLDAKTCQDASPSGFSRAIANYSYHLQAAHYSEGFERASGLKVLGFVFAAVEADWPHAAAAYMVDDDGMTRAYTERRRLLDRYAACKRSNEWPGYPSAIQSISLPAWAA